ncbi:MAG TPA: hypothetical protein VHV74_23495 [Pseudonocardiaceae bacterium]|nr:hypothetical protein [Pseudonocardiaceae bacterium]
MSTQPQDNDAELVARATRLVHESRQVGAFILSRGFAAAVTAYAAPLLVLVAVLASIPLTAHVLGEQQAHPIALLSILLFGPAAYAAFHKHRTYVYAKRYLKKRGIKA